jgi:hypothetical protein
MLLTCVHLSSVVLKGLGTNKELAALDSKLCSIHIRGSSSSSRDDSCRSQEALQQLLRAWVIPKTDLQG